MCSGKIFLPLPSVTVTRMPNRICIWKQTRIWLRIWKTMWDSGNTRGRTAGCASTMISHGNL